MKILVDIGHPGHVHFYKNFIWEMQKRGHKIMVTSREKDVCSALLNHYGIEHKTISLQRGGSIHMLQELLQRWQRLLNIMKTFHPDVVTDIGGAFISFPSKLSGVSSIIFTDTEHVRINKYITYPFSEKILTPTCFMKDLGNKHIRYNGFHEIAYLHPKYYKPNPNILDHLGLDKDQRYFILRFVSWEANHDFLQTGFSMEWKIKLIKQLEKYGRVFISSEKPVNNIFSDYAIQLPPHKIHDALYYADLFIGDGATMATESSLLGTPAIYFSSLVGTMGNFIELMDKYKLVYSFKSPKLALEKAIEILNYGNYKSVWNERKNRLFNDKINVTEFMIKLIENYPNSLYSLYEN